MAGVSELNPNLVRVTMALVSLGLTAYLLGPPLYWHLAEALSRADCSPCSCDCSSRPLLSISQELSNISFSSSDCAKRDPDVSEDIEKNFTDLLSEEVKLREAEAIEVHRREDILLLESKKLASQYQKEADKCNSGMDTCEAARERAESLLSEQKKLTALWEARARQRGWKLRAAKSQS